MTLGDQDICETELMKSFKLELPHSGTDSQKDALRYFELSLN